jgi:nucleotide-binding universal stress UspA family protein
MPTAIVGYNGSDGSEDALAFGCMLRRALDYELVVVSCLVDSFNRPAGGYVAALRRDAEDALASARRAIEDDRGVRFQVVRGTSAGRALHDAVERFGADLVVVGATHHRTAAEVFSASVTHQTIQAAPCAVAVAPAGFRDRPHPRLHCLSVAVDESPEALDALRRAGEVARRTGAQVKVIHVYRPVLQAVPLAAFSYGDPEYLEETRELAQDKLDRAVSALGDVASEIEVHEALLTGDPAERIVEVSEKSDLLFLGSRGYGPLRRALLGSVSGRVVRAARCPVIVTPRAALHPEPMTAGGRARAAVA